MIIDETKLYCLARRSASVLEYNRNRRPWSEWKYRIFIHFDKCAKYCSTQSIQPLRYSPAFFLNDVAIIWLGMNLDSINCIQSAQTMNDNWIFLFCWLCMSISNFGWHSSPAANYWTLTISSGSRSMPIIGFGRTIFYRQIVHYRMIPDRLPFDAQFSAMIATSIFLKKICENERSKNAWILYVGKIFY